MSCIKEERLYEYLDGILEASEREEVEDHLKGCITCQNKVAELKAFEKDLELFWKEFRKGCPSPEEMYEYGLGKLAKEDAERISKHLSICYICRIKQEESERVAEELRTLASSGGRAEAAPGISLGDGLKNALSKIASILNDLANKSKDITESLEGIWRNEFPYAQHVGLKFLQPAFGRVLERADVGEGFEKQVIQEEGSPFKIELDQFGKQLNIIFRTNSELFKYSIIRFELHEEGEKKISCILSVIDGVGKYTINLDGKEIRRPEKNPYNIKIDAISSMELLADLTDPKSSKIFAELSKSGDEEAEKFLAEVTGKGKT